MYSYRNLLHIRPDVLCKVADDSMVGSFLFVASTGNGLLELTVISVPVSSKNALIKTSLNNICAKFNS